MDLSSETASVPAPAKIAAEVVPQGGAVSVRRTFVRVKRHIDDDPATTLILSFKRQKVDGKVPEEKQGSYEVVNSVLKFAGSIQPEQEIGSFVKTLEEQTDSSPKEPSSKIFPVKAPAASSSARRLKTQKEAKQKSSACRYKIVSTKRGLEEIAEAADSESKENDESNYLYSMFDLVDDGDSVRQVKKRNTEASKDDLITCNGAPMVQVQNPFDYVFDVYSVATPLSVDGQHVNVEHLWESPENCLEPQESDEERNGHDQEDSDSNDENYRGNDYPDEESDASAGSNSRGYYQDAFYDSDDDDGEANGPEWMSGSRAMKELALHVKTLQLDEHPLKHNPENSSEDEMGGVYGDSEDDLDFEP